MSVLVQAATDLIKSLVPAFVAGFSVQQLLEIIDQFFDPTPHSTPTTWYERHKKVILGILALLIGWLIAFGINLRMLQSLGLNTEAVADNLITGVFISAGTAGFNSIMKYLNYAKENKKGQAQENQAVAVKTKQPEAAINILSVDKS